MAHIQTVTDLRADSMMLNWAFDGNNNEQNTRRSDYVEADGGVMDDDGLGGDG
jgi:hypothetical protein